MGEEVLQDTDSHAVALVASHPELSSGEPNSAADIHTNIIAAQLATQVLGQLIADQGPATPEGGWATQTPLINPATNQSYRNSQGQIQYMPQWSSTTASFAGQAITPSLDMAKDDLTLGVNVTTVDPTTITDNDTAAPTNGAIWALHDGMPTVDQSISSLLQATSLPYQFHDQTPGHGYSVAIDSLAVDSSGKVKLTFTAKNWFVRYLSLYVRYLDGNDQPIPLANLESQISNDFPHWDLATNGTYDAFLDIVSPEWVFLGMPIHTETIKKTIPVPPEAASVLILAGGMGIGSNPYPGSLSPGVEMTVVWNLAVPSLLLSLAAAAGYAGLTKQLQDSATLRKVIPILVVLVADVYFALAYDDPSVFLNLARALGGKLLSSAAGYVDQLIANAIAEGEAIEAVTDAIPVVGLFLNALAAVHLIAGLVETSAQVSNSPKSYIDKVSLTHDIEVTISHDPKNPAGFPATATHFIVTALFDGGSPRTLTQALPPGTVSGSITVPFKDVPAGGNVKVDVGFYSDTQWLAGQGSVGPVPNTATAGVLPLDITITENLVPLTTTTQYFHKEIITLDSSGNHQWHATTTAPTVVTPKACARTSTATSAPGPASPSPPSTPPSAMHGKPITPPSTTAPRVPWANSPSSPTSPSPRTPRVSTSSPAVASAAPPASSMTCWASRSGTSTWTPPTGAISSASCVSRAAMPPSTTPTPTRLGASYSSPPTPCSFTPWARSSASTRH